MKKVISFAILLFFIIIGAYSQSYKNLWTSTEYVSGVKHEMMLVYSYDDFEEKKFYNFTDVIQNLTSDIDLLFFHFHWLEKSGLNGITITINAKDWYFLTGKVALKFDAEIIRLEGKASSKSDYPTLQTKVFIWGLPTGFTERIKNLEDDKTVLLRVYTNEKGYIDIDMPIQFFKEAANMTIEKMTSLKKSFSLK